MLAIILGLIFTFFSSILCAIQGINITTNPFGLIFILLIFQRAGYILGEDITIIIRNKKMFKLNDVVIVNGTFEGLTLSNEKGKIIITCKSFERYYCSVLFYKKGIGCHRGYKEYSNCEFKGEQSVESNCWNYPLDFTGFKLAIPIQLDLFEE